MTNHERLLENFLRYVKIDSESGHEGAMCRQVEEDLAALGIQTGRIQSIEESDGYIVTAEIPGDPSKETLILSAHMDTVVPGKGIQPRLCEDGVIRSAGDTILGSDDKSGVAGIIEALTTAKEQNLTLRPLQLVFTIGEEVGLLGSKSLERSMLKGDKVVVFDTSGDIGRVVTAAPGQLKLRAFIYGKASHAGNAPEKGVSAIMAGALAVSRMKLLRIDEETTANIGVFHASGATNVVSPKAELFFEIRSKNRDKLYAQAEDMIRCLKESCEELGAKVEYELKESYLGFSIPDSDPLVQEVFRCSERIGCKPFSAAGGGGSDANIYNALGLTAVNAATGMTNCHAVNEEIKLVNLENTAELALSLMMG